MEKVVKGFEVTGIYPLNPDILEEDDILTSDLLIEDLPDNARPLTFISNITINTVYLISISIFCSTVCIAK